MHSARFALHRPEFLEALMRGEEKIAAITQGGTFKLGAGATLIQGGARTLADGRNQFILIFLPGDLFAVKSPALL
jgi:hypothetical protein